MSPLIIVGATTCSFLIKAAASDITGEYVGTKVNTDYYYVERKFKILLVRELVWYGNPTS